ncbi:uncharacterized protein LOC135555198 [Oncorhynchus masou masou]|uniref:uncharacterized protein LOC135555198 n=1 Tax=Oncorhynchus masou masou TaxID=90313 RepID=UPI00318399F0
MAKVEKKKKVSNIDTLQEQRKNNKEMEFELKAGCREGENVLEPEQEDLEESEKVQHWVERLCQTQLEQISCVENESPKHYVEPPLLELPFLCVSVRTTCVSGLVLQVSPPCSPASGPMVSHFYGGLQLATTDLDDFNFDEVDQSLKGPLKRLVPTQPSSSQPPPALPLPPLSPRLNPAIPNFSPPSPQPSAPPIRKPPPSASTAASRGSQLRPPPPSKYPPYSSHYPLPHSPTCPPPPPGPPLLLPHPFHPFRPPPPQHPEERLGGGSHGWYHHHHPSSHPETRSKWKRGGYLPRGGYYSSNVSEITYPSNFKVATLGCLWSGLKTAPSPCLPPKPFS